MVGYILRFSPSKNVQFFSPLRKHTGFFSLYGFEQLVSSEPPIKYKAGRVFTEDSPDAGVNAFFWLHEVSACKFCPIVQHFPNLILSGLGFTAPNSL